VIQERLKDAIEKRVPLIKNMSKEKIANMAGDAFSPGAYWDELECDSEYVLDQIPHGFNTPTLPVGEIFYSKKKKLQTKL